MYQVGEKMLKRWLYNSEIYYKLLLVYWVLSSLAIGIYQYSRMVSSRLSLQAFLQTDPRAVVTMIFLMVTVLNALLLYKVEDKETVNHKCLLLGMIVQQSCMRNVLGVALIAAYIWTKYRNFRVNLKTVSKSTLMITVLIILFSLFLLFLQLRITQYGA